MDSATANRSLAAVLVVQIVIYLVSLPGVGLDPRSYTSFAKWAQPTFLVLTLLVFALSIAGAAAYSRRSRGSAESGIAAGAASIVAILLDFSAVGGPAPPSGPLVLGSIGLVVGAAAIYLGARVLTRPTAGMAGAPSPPPT